MLDVRRQAGPKVATRLVDGDARLRKSRIGEGADCYRDHIWKGAQHPVDGRAAIGAEVEGQAVAAVGNARERCGTPLDLHPIAGKARLDAKYAAGPLLTLQAMADGDPNRFTVAEKSIWSSG